MTDKEEKTDINKVLELLENCSIGTGETNETYERYVFKNGIKKPTSV